MRPTESVAVALEALARAIREGGAERREAAQPRGTTPVTLPWSVLLWRTDLVPADTLLTIEQLAEASGWSRAAIYRRTSAWHRTHGTCASLPHVRVAGVLRFRAGELRQWFADHAEVIVAARAPVTIARGRQRRARESADTMAGHDDHRDHARSGATR